MSLRATWFFWLLLILPLPAAAQAIPLDESASPRQRIQAQADWFDAHRSFELSHDELNRIVARADAVEVRLNTAAYVGRQARIFLVVPAFLPGLVSEAGMRMSWSTRGHFAPGAISPGQRVVLFSGLVTEPEMSDFLDLSIVLDSRLMSGAVNVEMSYEIELQ